MTKPDTLLVDDGQGSRQEITANHIILAPGSITAEPPIEGRDLPGVVTSTGAMDIDTVPARSRGHRGRCHRVGVCVHLRGVGQPSDRPGNGPVDSARRNRRSDCEAAANPPAPPRHGDSYRNYRAADREGRRDATRVSLREPAARPSSRASESWWRPDAGPIPREWASRRSACG